MTGGSETGRRPGHSALSSPAPLAPAWPPADVTTSAGLTQASMALVGGIIGGIGEQLLRAAIVTFAAAVGLIAASLADLL